MSPQRRTPTATRQGFPESIHTARIDIGNETLAHRASVRSLCEAAFGGAAEADLVERLHAEGLATLALVALDHGQVIGHVLFSPLAVEIDGRTVDAVSLAPVSVRPERQSEGIGSKLIRAGLEQLANLGVDAVFVVGHPPYYPRFGFSAALAERFSAPFQGEAFMALELIDGALHGESGSVRYPAAFGIETHG